MYSSKVRLQHIKISAQLHMIEAQDRHEKSPKKKTSRIARCGSSGGLLIYVSPQFSVIFSLLGLFFAYIFFIFGLLPMLLDKVPLPDWCGWILAVPGRVMSPHIYVCNTKSRLTPDTDPISTLTNQGNLYPQRTQAMSYCVHSTLGGMSSRVYACIFIIITTK